MLISKIRLLGLVIGVSVVVPGSFAQDKPTETATVEIRNAVEGERQIIQLVDQGTVVKKGDILCELDSAGLRERLTDQLIATKRAEADYFNAVKTREVAQISLNEQTNAIAPAELASAEGDLKIAEGERVVAEAKLTAYKHEAVVHKITQQELELAVTRADVAIRKAKSRLEHLLMYQHPRREKGLRADVEKARSDELSTQQVYDIQQERMKKLATQVELCVIKAPVDGMVVYPKPRASSRPATAGIIAPGAIVREHQLLLSIEPSRKAQDP